MKKKNTITDEEYMEAYEAYMREQEQRKQLEDELDKFILELGLDEDDEEDEQEQETKKKRVAKRKQVKRWKGTTTTKKRSRKAAVKDDSFLAEVSAA